jgi:hypothetical protein
MNVMEHQAGGHDKLGFIPRDLYISVKEYMMKKIEGRDAEYMLNYMASQKDKVADFFYRCSTDKEDHLRNIFWAVHSHGWTTMPLAVSWSLTSLAV